MKKVKVLSVNISEKKGTIKYPVKSITLTETGVDNDAHRGSMNRQVSLLGIESIRKFEKEAGRRIGYGEFAENITTRGLELWNCHPLDRFSGEGFDLEVTQIGKECHGNTCSIFREVGNCVMPKEGIFARASGLQRPASLQAGTFLEYFPKIYSARIITLSDRASKGEYEDLSGPRLQEILGNFFMLPSLPPRILSHCTLLPDDSEQLRSILKESIGSGTDFIFTTGGTGIGPRDITVDVTRTFVDKEIPGIMEMIRMKYGSGKPQALLSRSIAGVAGKSLIFTLPGSVRAVNEYMDEILKSLMHMVYMLHGLDAH